MSAQFTQKSPMQRRKNAWIAATFVGMGLYLAAFLSAGEFDGHMTWLHWLGLAAAGVSAASAFGWIASLDEVARQVHFEAWYWGGSAGLCVSAFALLALVLAAPVGIGVAHLDVDEGIALGFVLGVVPAAIGYAIWWTALWLRRR